MSYVVSFPLDARCRPEKRCRDGVTVARRAGGFRAACWAWSAVTSSGESWGIKPQRSVERTEFEIVLGSGRLPIFAFRRAAWKGAPCQARCRAGVGMALQFRLVLGAQDLRARRHLGTGAVPLSRSSAMRDVRVPVGRPVRATPRGVADTDGRRSRRRTSRSTVVLLFTIPNRRGSGPRGRRTEPVAARGQIDSRPRPRPRPRPKPGRHRTLCLSKERP